MIFCSGRLWIYPCSSDMSLEIKTKRLILREITEEDTDFIVEVRSDESAYRFFKNPHKITKEEHLNWFRNIYPKNPLCTNYIAEDTNGLKVGVFAVSRDEEDSDIVEVSYILSRVSRGKGYASEAVKGLMEHVENELHINKFTAVVHKDNEASVKLLRRLGFEREESDGVFVTYKRIA